MKEEYGKLRSAILDNLGIDHTVTGDLLNLYFSKNTTPDSLAAFFAKYDIELLEYQCVWLVSKLASQLHYAGVPKEQLPRIKGVVKRFTVENGRSFCELPGVLEAFNKADIAVMLLNGTAMKVFYEPTETRYQNGIDLLVHPGDVKKAGFILEEQGFILHGASWEQRFYQKNDVRVILHSTSLHGDDLTDDLADIWRQSREITWQGKKVFVPCPEVMLLILLVQGLEDCCLRISDCQANRFVSDFLDIKFFLADTSLDWDRFIKLAPKSRTTLQARLMLDILNRLYLGTAPEEVVNALPFTDKDIANVQRLISYNVAKKQAINARNRRNRMAYYYNGVAALWNLNCYYGNSSSLLSDIIDFPKFITEWNNNRGIKGLLSRLGGCKR